MPPQDKCLEILRDKGIDHALAYLCIARGWAPVDARLYIYNFIDLL